MIQKKINYNKRSKFLNIIIENLNKNVFKINLSSVSTSEGYEGSFIIEILKSHFIVENFNNYDKTRFPARIKATASAMNRIKKYGKYRITHENKVITIKVFVD